MRVARALDFCADMIACEGCSGVRFVVWVVGDTFLASAGSIFEEGKALHALAKLSGWLLPVVARIHAHYLGSL
jgi:hypothetical protein